MKTLKRYSTLLQYSITPEYFGKYSDVKKTQHTSSYWAAGIEDSYVFYYEIFFSAKNATNNELLVNYHSIFELHCIIENIELDASEIINYKEMENLSTQLFLMQNTHGYYDLLDFHPMTMTYEQQKDKHWMSTRLSKEIIDIKRVMGILTLEEMSIEESVHASKKDN